MRGLPFTMRQLEVFASLCMTHSFRRSAELLGISQASISNQMKVLEEQLGVVLLARGPGKRPRLTREGLAFQEDLLVFEAAGKALAAHRKREPDTVGPVRFRLFVGQGLFDNYVRPKLGHFIAANPNIELDFDAQPPNDLVARVLVEGRYDFGLFHLRADIPIDPRFRSLAMLRGGVYGHYRFAEGRPLPLAPEEVAQLPFLLSRSGSTQEREALLALERYGIRPRHIVGNSQYYDVIAAMLDRGVAVATFTEALIAPAARADMRLLFPMKNWRLVWFRLQPESDPQRDAVERFLIESVLNDPNYPIVEFDGDEGTTNIGSGRLTSN